MSGETWVDVIAPCDECGATGVVYDPYGFGWERLFQLTDDQYEREMKDRGYGYEGKDADGNWPPSEEGTCPTCCGTKEVRKRITLGAFKRLLEEAM